jgi:hypothetical protein
MTAPRTLTSTERDWLRVRSYLQEYRYDLAVAAANDYPPGAKVDGTPLLTTPGWRPSGPVPLRDISLTLRPADSSLSATAAVLADRAALLLPERADGTPYCRYSEAMAELAAPSVFENRFTYRLTDADLSGSVPRLEFTRGRYFDGIDTGEAAAHEYAATWLGYRPAGLRSAIGDPVDLDRRPVNLAITTLTLRLDRSAGRASFLLHWRDPAKVGHAGGLYQVIPVGMFQASGEAAWNERPDFSLWRCMIREFAEELAGHPEDYGNENGPIDYEAWPFAQHMTGALDSGQIRVWCLGLGADPLTYATDLLTVAVIDSDVFDGLFGSPQCNAEGNVLAAREFGSQVVEQTVTREPMQAAGAAVLRLAWLHRQMLIS